MDIGNALPWGASHINDGDLTVSMEPYLSDSNEITIEMIWNSKTKLRNDKLLLFMDSKDWNFKKDPLIILYRDDEMIKKVENPLSPIFSGALYELEAKDITTMQDQDIL